jgi:hypothetical protein
MRTKIEPLTTSTIESQEGKLISIPSWSVQLTLGNQPESTLHTCPRYGKLILRRQSEHSMWSPNSARELTTRSHQETTVPRTVCCDTGGSQSTSSWIRSSPPRRLASCLEVTPVASFSLLTRDSSTSFP